MNVKDTAQGKQEFKKRGKRNLIILFIMLLCVLAACMLSLMIGTVSFNKDIVVFIRLPRTLAAVFAGLSLASSGLLMQGIFQNPLVSPYTLGLSNGAAFGASLAIVLRSRFIQNETGTIETGHYLPALFAFVFSFITMLVVYALSRIKKHDSKVLLLSGIAISYLFQSLVSALRYTSNVRDLPELIFWTMGNLGAIPFSGILMMGIVSTSACFVMMFFAWDLNTITQGEETSVSLGVDYKKIMIISFLISTLLTASVVSWTGVIGFVGLVAPHISRMIVGGDYRFTIPASALTGALLLLLSDTLARTLFSPVELPVGVITSFIGVPFFIYLIVRKGKNK